MAKNKKHSNKSIQKVVIEDRKNKVNPTSRFNVKVLTSVDNGKTFSYAGQGRFTGTKKEALFYKKRFLQGGK